MTKKDIIKNFDKSLKVPVGDVSDEWKAPAVVVGDSNGAPFIQIRAESRPQAKELRDKVKAALSDKYDIGQGIIEFDPIQFRFSQHLTIKEKKS